MKNVTAFFRKKINEVEVALYDMKTANKAVLTKIV